MSDTHETLHNKMHDEDLSPVNFKFFLTIILFELYRFVMLQIRKIILYELDGTIILDFSIELRLRQDRKGIGEQGGAETTIDASHMGHTKSW